MPEPTTPLKALIIPNTGDLPGTWGSAAVNPDFTAIDGMLGGVTTVALSNSNVNLTAPAGTITPGSGPNQAQNYLIVFTGTLTGNVAVLLPLPGYYIVRNTCAGTGSFYILLTTPNAGNYVCAPDLGDSSHVYSDGTNTFYANMGRVGEIIDLCTGIVPPWMLASTPNPYLKCDGSGVSTTTYSNLFARIGYTFGGAGGTFNVPDLRARYRIPLDNSAGRVTTAGSGVDGTTVGASGGSQNQTLVSGQLPLTSTSTETVAHTHTLTAFQDSGLTVAAGSGPLKGGATAGITTSTESATHTHLLGTASPTPVTTVPPGLVFGISMIKT